MAARIAINGAFVGRPVTGLERFARECVRALDGLVEPGVFRLVVPPGADLAELAGLRNIDVAVRGFGRGAFWEQVCFGPYARLRGLRTLNLCNTAPFLRTGVVCIHDVFYRSRAADFAGTLRGRLSSLWHRLHYAWCARRADRIVTVSRHSAEEIARCYGVPSGRIVVAGNGWGHLSRIVADDGVFARFPDLAPGGYFLALGSRAPNKNFRWIERTAARNPDLRFVVAGGVLASAASTASAARPNLFTTGRVTDGEMKALLQRCRALLFPSLEEGFGIPPLEALALGRPAVVADRPPMREIYGDAVHYILDPEGDSETDVAALLATPAASPQGVLARHTWVNVARAVLAAVVPIR